MLLFYCTVLYYIILHYVIATRYEGASAGVSVTPIQKVIEMLSDMLAKGKETYDTIYIYI